MARPWLLFSMIWSILPWTAFPAPKEDTLSGTISLSRALELALLQSPEFAASKHEVSARDGEVLQARLPSNPELVIEMENWSATGVLREENQEFTARLIQTLDLSQIPRASVADREKDLARMEMETVRKRIGIRVHQRFISLLAAQERLALSRDLVFLAGAVHGLAAEKVRAGKVPPTDSLQAFIALSLTRIDSGKASHELDLARQELASVCGLPRATYDSADGRLGPVQPLPDWNHLVSRLPSNPEWKQGDLEIKAREAQVRADKMARLPPVTLEAGIRRFPEENGRAWIAGASLPIPIWNWNQGAIRTAKARKAKSDEEAKARRLELMQRLTGLYNQAASSYREASALVSQVLPAATATFQGIQEAYRLGKFGSLDALNAQRSLFEARARYLDALTEYHLAKAELEGMLGEANPAP